MSRKLAISFFVHTLRSDWNNGNAHFLRGLARALGTGPALSVTNVPAFQGHSVTIYEPFENWSTLNLAAEPKGEAALTQFACLYPDLHIVRYPAHPSMLKKSLAEQDIVIVHEWNSPELIEKILSLRDELGFRALFHDTHHRASSNPKQLESLQVARFDGVLAFGEALRSLYQHNFGIEHVWTLHEAADVSVFYPQEAAKEYDALWIGNWGDEERSRELREFLIYPAAKMPTRTFQIYGVRYPDIALDELSGVGIQYGGYLPNLAAPAAYAATRVTMHVPRQQYATAIEGIPTIRVFEALASGVPLISAPWKDREALFSEGDFLMVRSSYEMTEAIEHLLNHPDAAREQSERGLLTVLGRHTCAHRALELTDICEEVLA